MMPEKCFYSYMNRGQLKNDVVKKINSYIKRVTMRNDAVKNASYQT
ncbi:hypothetical protein BSG1_00960 [Bacillus sp. SG-1]|nr:hypothetical protein BSG1_00960 [Bacillus sp. SG-1]